MLDIDELRAAIRDPGWDGPDHVFMMFYDDDNPVFVSKVTPDPEWSFQRWQSASYIRVDKGLPPDLAPIYFEAKEISEADFGTHVVFKTFPRYDVNATDMSGFD